MENEISHLKIEEIVPKNNVPQELTNDYLQNNLVQSILDHGIIQPIVVKKNNDKYEIIDGNRRYFAARKAGLNKIPALVRNDNHSVTKLEVRDDLYNNDLSPIEEAKKYKEILEQEKITQEQLAKKIGKSQSALANKLRLLNLPYEIQVALDKFEISERHARSLLTVKNEYMQLELLKKIKEKKLTVRELDSEIKNMSNMFIPEEFSNNNINNVTNDMNYNQSNNTFMSLNSNDYNQSNNMFMPQNNSNYNQMSNLNNNNGNINDSNTFDNTMNQNTFIPNNNDLPSVFNNNYNVQGTDMNMSNEPINDSGMNPFFTNNDYAAPISNNNANNMNSINNIDSMNQPNPFSSIRMNTNNINNNANNSLNSNINEVSPDYDDYNNTNEFDINDYKLPEYENNSDNNINDFGNNFSGNSSVLPEIPDTNEYKYVEDNPNYVSVDKPVGVSSVDDVIEVLSGALDIIKNGRIKVDTEEIDYDDTYQITIRIDKKGDFL